MQLFSKMGVFYDAGYFSYAQTHYYTQKRGWLIFDPIHRLLENWANDMQLDTPNPEIKLVSAFWFEGIRHAREIQKINHLEIERNRHIDLLRAGIDLRFFHLSEKVSTKGVDVMYASEVIYQSIVQNLDIVVIVSGDGGLVPLVQTLQKLGKKVLMFHFEYETEERKQKASSKLMNVCNGNLLFSDAEIDPRYAEICDSAFRKLDHNEHT